MIIKIWQYRDQIKDLVGGAAKQARSFDIAIGCSSYIIGLAASGEHHNAFVTAERVGEYAIIDPEGEGSHRIVERYADNLSSNKVQDHVRDMAVYAAGAGLDRLWHMTWSHRKGEAVDSASMRRQRATICRIMGIEECPSVGAFHGDTPNSHGHHLSVSINAATGGNVSFGYGWWKEAAQIAIAVCEYQEGLGPEPNRRYVADETGVYHTFSDIKIADPRGSIIKNADGKIDHQLIHSIQSQHEIIFDNNKAGPNDLAGEEWPMSRVAHILAAPRIQNAKDWPDLHSRLARVGLRYVKVGNTAVLETVPQNGKQKSLKIAAGKAYSNAALGKLQAKFGTPYVPPCPDLKVRPFVMPRFDKPTTDRKKENSAARWDLSQEAKKLTSHMQTDNLDRQEDYRDGKKGANYNYLASRQRQMAEEELSVAKQFAVAIGARRTRRKRSPDTGKLLPKPTISTQFLAIIWSRFKPDNGKVKADIKGKLAKRYQIEKRLGRIEYYEGKRLMFVETQNMIAIRSTARRAQIDALRLAAAKLSSVRIFGKPAAIANTVFLAAELGLQLEDQQNSSGEKHCAQIEREPHRGILERHRVWLDVAPKLKVHRDKERAAKQKRRQQAELFTDSKIETLGMRNQIAREAARNKQLNDPLPGRASRILDNMDRNTLLLASSRGTRGGYRYLDDPALFNAFSKTPEALLLSETQMRLEAIEHTQMEQRKWFCAAMHSDRIIVKGGKVEISKPEDHWVIAFHEQQKDDPTFNRLMAVSYLRPDRFKFDTDIPPEIVAWRSARATNKQQMADYIADELHLRVRSDKRDPQSGAEECRRIFQLIPYEAQALRDTPGHFLSQYKNWSFRKPDESEAQWERRRKLIIRINNSRGR
tara:strand:- start:2035 stop:4653 length:2619 start_codon:yes stop_codon:yes gene_type:complete